MEKFPTPLQCAHVLIEIVPRLTMLMRKDLRMHSAGDFTEPQFRVMAYLFRGGELCLSDLAEYQGVSLPTMSKLVQGLESRGLVLRQRNPDDRRRVVLTLTPEGQDAYKNILLRTEEHVVEWIHSLTPGQRAEVVNGFTLINAVFSQVDLEAFYT